MAIRQMLARSGAVLVIALLVSGCGPGATRSSSTTTATALGSGCHGPIGSEGDCAGPRPIVLKDTSPGQLALSLSLQIGGYTADTRDTTEMTVSFGS
jgi:hypothetical protein